MSESNPSVGTPIPRTDFWPSSGLCSYALNYQGKGALFQLPQSITDRFLGHGAATQPAKVALGVQADEKQKTDLTAQGVGVTLLNL